MKSWMRLPLGARREVFAASMTLAPWVLDSPTTSPACGTAALPRRVHLARTSWEAATPSAKWIDLSMIAQQNLSPVSPGHVYHNSSILLCGPSFRNTCIFGIREQNEGQPRERPLVVWGRCPRDATTRNCPLLARPGLIATECAQRQSLDLTLAEGRATAVKA